MATSTERFGFTKPAGSDPASVVPLNSNIDLIELYLGRTQDSIAPIYDDTETYSVGDLRTYESRLYKCNTDISTPETFDPEKWDLTTAVQEGGGSGASAIEKTLSEYNALTPAQKENGSIYMVQGEGASEDAFDMTQGSSHNEGSMSFTATETDIESVWNGGGSIGGDWRTIAIDVTKLTAIKFSIKTTTCYAHNNSNVEEQTTPRFVNTVYLFTSIPSGWAYDYESQAMDFLKFAYTNTDYGEQEFDVSELTGQLYVIWASTGWNAVMSDLTLVGKSSLNNRIFFMNEEYANTGGGTGLGAIEKTQAEYNALTPEQKKNGAIYMVKSEVGEKKDLTERMSDYTSSSGTVSAYNSKNANFLAWHALASEDSFDASVNGKYWAGNGDGAYLQFDFTNPVIISKIGFASYLASNFKIMYSTDGDEYIYAQNVTREAQSGYICTKTDTTLDSPIRDCISIRLVCDGAEYNIGALHFYGYDSVESVNKIYYMGTEYANTNGGSGSGGNMELSGTELLSTPISADGTYTLEDTVEDYDYLAIQSGASNERDLRTLIVDEILDIVSNNLVVTNVGTNGRWFNITALSGNQISVTRQLATIYSIKGYRYREPKITVHEYAEFDGTDYFTTPFEIDEDLTVEVTFQSENISPSSIYGNLNASSYSHLTIYSNTWYMSAGTSETHWGTFSNTKHTFESNKNGKNVFDGTEVTNYTPTSVSGARYIIGYRIQSANFQGKLYEFKLTSISSGDEVYDLVPADKDGVVGLYDKVSRTFTPCDFITLGGAVN